jgi:hypothetical protein
MGNEYTEQCDKGEAISLVNQGLYASVEQTFLKILTAS